MQFRKFLRPMMCVFAFGGVSFAGVTVNSPRAGSSYGSPVHFVASANANSPITGMRIYVDGLSVYHTNANAIDTSVPIAAGTHPVVIQAWDQTGAVYKQALSLSVSAAAPSPTPTPSPTPSASPSPTPSPTPGPGLPSPPASAVTVRDIDQLSGWESCTVCAGANAKGPVATYSMLQNQLSPSIDGKSSRFNISGPTPYSNVLWWKQLGGNNTIRNFRYEVYFYLTNPQLAQALEFDVNQSDSVHKFIFGTQCNIHTGQATGHWDVWGNASGNWLTTGIPCSAPSALTWHHLVWEFQRTDTNVTYIGFTYDGVTHFVNRSYPARTNHVKEINVAFQMDGNSKMNSYSAWLDKVSLMYW